MEERISERRSNRGLTRLRFSSPFRSQDKERQSAGTTKIAGRIKAIRSEADCVHQHGLQEEEEEEEEEVWEGQNQTHAPHFDFLFF